MMARFAGVLQGGLARFRRAARTDCRRPLIVAVAAGFILLQLLPGGASLQRVMVVNPGGWVEQAFSLPADDPRLGALRQAAAAASRPDYASRTDDYYRAQWDVTAAEFYAGQTLTIDAAASSERRSQTSETVAQALFVRPASSAEHRDWKVFWEELRETSAARLRSLEPTPSVDPVFARLRFGELTDGPLPTTSVFGALCVAALVFLTARRWACHPPQRLIPLQAHQQLLVPSRWYRQRRSLHALTGRLTRGRMLECAAAVIIVALLLSSWH